MTMACIDAFCVFAGSSAGARPEYRAAAAELGAALARRRIDVVFGGGQVGLMGVLADAVLENDGHITGVIPEALVSRDIAHAGLPDLRIVRSMHERKALMAELSDAFVALPGGWGTLEEFFEVLTWAQLGLHRKPCVLLNVAGYFDGLLSFLDHAIDERFVRAENGSLVLVASSVEALLGQLERYQPSPAPTRTNRIDRAETYSNNTEAGARGLRSRQSGGGNSLGLSATVQARHDRALRPVNPTVFRPGCLIGCSPSLVSPRHPPRRRSTSLPEVRS